MESVMKKKVSSYHLVIPLIATLLCFMFSGVAKGSESIPTLTYHGEDFIENNRNGSMWTKKRSKRFKSQAEVEQYLNNLNSGQYKDWRLPTKQELYNLIVLFDLKDNGDIKVPIEGSYWYVGDYSNIEVGAWEIGDGCGFSRKFYSGTKGYVWPVRP